MGMRGSIVLLSALGALSAAASAEETRIDVRVISHDGKFVGSGMGGVLAKLADADTGEVLAEGVITGTTGDTDRLMKTPRPRNFTLSTPDAAVFHASIDIDEPQLVELTLYGPLAQRQSAARISITRWVLPGKHLTDGDGWLVEMPGLAVDVLEPAAGGRAKVGDEITLDANVVMMCGCPFTSSGLWNAHKLEVVASIKQNGEQVKIVPLEPGDEASRFSARFTPGSRGAYEVAVTAFDPASGNAGADFSAITVE